MLKALAAAHAARNKKRRDAQKRDAAKKTEQKAKATAPAASAPSAGASPSCANATPNWSVRWRMSARAPVPTLTGSDSSRSISFASKMKWR